MNILKAEFFPHKIVVSEEFEDFYEIFDSF